MGKRKMNFEFWKECKSQDEKIQQYYQKMAKILIDAENCYWAKPVECSMLLQGAAKDICQIYNHFFELEFPENAGLSELLCYNGNDIHDGKVSKFLCAVSDDQRNQLNLIRALGEECVFLDANPDHRDAQDDKLYLNVKKMMIAMMDCLKYLLIAVEGRTDVEALVFDEDEVPGEPLPKPVPQKEAFWKKFKKK
ncbi:MAG: hypothetical protein ACI4ES_03670 [Roseburia sp.]